MNLWIAAGFALIGLTGITVFAYLGLKLRAKSARLAAELAPLRQQVAGLQELANSKGDYRKPATNLQDDPVKTTQLWLKRRNASERKKAERQRRLIRRLTNRK